MVLSISPPRMLPSNVLFDILYSMKAEFETRFIGNGVSSVMRASKSEVF